MPIISSPITASLASRSAARHEFAYPRVRQIAPRPHTVLASSLELRAAQPAGAAR